MRRKALEDRTLEDFLALGAIREGDVRMEENEKIREFKRMRKLEGVKGREVFVERKERGVMKNMKR